MADDNKFYWIKLNTDFFADNSPMDFLLGVPNGAEYVALYVKLCLATANNDGKLCCNFGEMIVPYNIEKIQRDMKHFSIDTVRVAMQLYKQMGLIYEEDDGILRITDYKNMVGSSTKWAEYKRNERLGQKLDNVQNQIGQCPTEIEIEKEINIDKEKDKDKDKEIKKDKKTKVLASASCVWFPTDELLNDTFCRFIEMRKAIKKPLTEYAAQLKIERLKELAGNNNDLAVKILKQSIGESWQDLYPLKKKNGGRPDQTEADGWLNA